MKIHADMIHCNNFYIFLKFKWGKKKKLEKRNISKSFQKQAFLGFFVQCHVKKWQVQLLFHIFVMLKRKDCDANDKILI